MSSFTYSAWLMWSSLWDRTMHNVQSPSLKTGDEEFLKKITDLRDYCMESTYNEVLHLSSESLVVSHQVHGNNISRRIQKKESVILPQYLISLRVITSSEGGNFSSRTLCLSLQCKLLLLVVTETLYCICWLVCDVLQIYYHRWFGLIDCEIGVGSE